MTRTLAACCLTLLAPAALVAQADPPPAQVVPLTDAVTVAAGETQSHDLVAPDIAVLGQREFLVTWDLSFHQYSGSQLVDWGSAISGRKVSLLGQPTGEDLVLDPYERHTNQGFQRLAADADGRFAILWQDTPGGFLLRRFAPDGALLGDTRLSPPLDGDYQPMASLSMDPSGRFAVGWRWHYGLWVELFDSTAASVAGAFEVPLPDQIIGRPVVATSRGTTLAIAEIYLGSSTYLALQRIGADGRPRGPQTPVVGRNSIQYQPAVAANAEGRFVAAWVDPRGIGARLFDASGNRLGPVIRVTDRPRARVPEVAVDPQGNFLVAWTIPATRSGSTSEIRARLFNRDGVPQGGEAILVPESEELSNTEIPVSVAMTGGGTFLAAWSAYIPDPEEFSIPAIRSRLFALLRDDDRCVWRDGTFLCDTAYDGNLTHQELRFGASGDRPLLADFDGDGLDNPCVRRGTAFRCARPGRSDLVLRFGRSTHTPLAGDLDGDGDDDPCVRRGRSFLCDTGHDGGAPEVDIPLGTASDEPDLGDVDGDGDDDPCIWSARAEAFLCDVTHDGTPILVYPADAQPGDRPLLGDLDGDGRADFCFARGETLLCDLDRDGLLTEEELATEAGDVVVLGNVDGM
jgi:hypothetical protein